MSVQTTLVSTAVTQHKTAVTGKRDTTTVATTVAATIAPCC